MNSAMLCLFCGITFQLYSLSHGRVTSDNKYMFFTNRLMISPSGNDWSPEFVMKKPEKRYKPVIFIHGLNDKPDSLQDMVDLIKKEHSGTDVHYIDTLHGRLSFLPLWFQVDMFYDKILPIMTEATDGVIMIGYSQGGLIARGIIESKLHNVQTFISLAAPQAGQYGDVLVPRGVFGKKILKKEAYYVFYSRFGQDISVGNFWNDPHHQDLYLNYSRYLPCIDNIKPEEHNSLYKSNFVKLNRLILIGGPDDGVISPWQSSHLSFYNEKEEIVDFRDREIFTQDLFGLKTLFDAKKVTIYSVPNVSHLDWHRNPEVTKKYILPWLD